MTQLDTELKRCPLCPDGGQLHKTKYDNKTWVIGCCVCEIEVSNGDRAICADIWNNLPRSNPITSEEAQEALNYLDGSQKLGDIRDFLPESIEKTIRRSLEGEI